MITNKKKKIKTFKRKISSVLFFTIVILIIVFLISTNWKINKRRNDLIEKRDTLQAQIQELEEKNRQLKKQEIEAGSKDHLEEAAREQLDLKKPGEEVIIIQKEEEEENNVEEEQSWWGKFKSIWTRD